MNFLVGIPVYNEAPHVRGVIHEVRKYARNIAVVDDGSSDGSSDLLRELKSQGAIQHLLCHESNQGYGRALFQLMTQAKDAGYDCLVTLDCDEQHEPRCIPAFVERIEGWDIVSGTRYPGSPDDTGDAAPPDRLQVNQEITAKINQLTGYALTDGFCGFKAYSRRALEVLEIREPGYGMPLEVWLKAAAAGLKVLELPVPRIYKDQTRSFGGDLDHKERRLRYYYQVIDRTLEEIRA